MRRSVLVLLVCLALLVQLPIRAADPPAAPAASPPAEEVPPPSPMMFIQNVGQFAPQARFQMRGGPG